MVAGSLSVFGAGGKVADSEGYCGSGAPLLRFAAHRRLLARKSLPASRPEDIPPMQPNQAMVLETSFSLPTDKSAAPFRQISAVGICPCCQRCRCSQFQLRSTPY